MKPDVDALAKEFRDYMRAPDTSAEAEEIEAFEDALVALGVEGFGHAARYWYAGRAPAPPTIPDPALIAKMAEAVREAVAPLDLDMVESSATLSEIIREAMHSVLPTIAETRPEVDAFLLADRYRAALMRANKELTKPYYTTAHPMTVLMAIRLENLERDISKALEAVV